MCACRATIIQLSRYHRVTPENTAPNFRIDSQFVVIERDGESGTDARCKQIKRIDLSTATDISDLDRLPPLELPSDIHPASKSTYLDLLDTSYGLAGTTMPEKLEGLTFGPNLLDGRRTLIIAVDNDFKVDAATLMYVFGCQL